MPSPVRRSARGALPSSKPAPPASTTSSSSLSSSRQDRSARNMPSKQKSDTPRSLSSEDVSEPPRRSQRAHPAASATGNKLPSNAQEPGEGGAEGDEHAIVDAEEEEEVTRCVCGHQEYPGPPLSEAFTDAEIQSDDAGGLFISCDGCSVWQHGGCVGIVEDSQAPEKYYCEECRPKLHDLHTDTRGQKYSLYIPLHPKPTRKASMSKHGDKAQKERELTVSRLSADPATGRRRATMRSKEHDDEEEQFLRAIEESKREVETTTGGRRGGKRSRDESEDNKPDIKRQRTASESRPDVSRTVSHDGESDGEGDGLGSSGRTKKARAEAVQSARQAELREKEKEREKARAEAAGRRQERAGRRRGDEAEADETPKLTADTPASPPLSSQPPSPAAEALPDKSAQKRGPGRKTKRLGNNQYTRNRDSSHPGASSPRLKKRGPGGSSNGVSSGDEQLANGGADGSGSNTHKNSPALDGEAAAVTAGGSTVTGATANTTPTITNATTSVPPAAAPPAPPTTKSKFGRGKGKAALTYNGSRFTATLPQDIADLTIPDMARQISAMTAFMARAQADLASSVVVFPAADHAAAAAASSSSPAGTLATSSDGSTHDPNSKAKLESSSSAAVASEIPRSDAAGPATAVTSNGASATNGFLRSSTDGRKFDELSAAEMADVLGRNMALWESRFVPAPAGPSS